MIREVLNVKNPVLRKKSKRVKKIDKKIRSFIKDLKDTLTAQVNPEGVGLAAPQIGTNLRVFAMKPGKKIIIVINPEIIDIAKMPKNPKERKILEGCLSLPNYYSPIVKPNWVRVKYQSESGKELTKDFEGFEAQIVQHEIDHLDGTLFVDRMLEQKKPLYKVDGDEWEEVELV